MCCQCSLAMLSTVVDLVVVNGKGQILKAVERKYFTREQSRFTEEHAVMQLKK